jgi:hypothetical protein
MSEALRERVLVDIVNSAYRYYVNGWLREVEMT